VRLLKMKMKNQIIILMYHAVVRSPLEIYDWCFIDELSFRRQLKYLIKNFEIISLSEAVERIKNATIYRPSAVITFDDGFQNNYEIAFPILLEARAPATIFLITGLVNTDDTVWYCRLNRALAETKKASLELDGTKLDLSGTDAKARSSSAIKHKLKTYTHPQLLTRLQKIILELGADPDRPVEIGSPFRMLGHQEINKMVASGLIEFGAHTHSHAILSPLSPRQRYEEIIRSVNTIEELTERQCKFFAYPNGRPEDYDEDTIKILESCGVRASVTTIEGSNDEMTPLMELRRHAIGEDSVIYKSKREYLRQVWQRL